MIFGISPMIFYSLNQYPQDQFVSIISPLSNVGIVARAAEKITSNPLADITDKMLINDHESYGVYIKNLKTGEEYGYNQNVKFESASLYKLWVMGAVFEKISNGDLSFSQELSSGANVSNAIEKMITISDNDAALSLVSKIGSKSVNSFISEYNFSNSEFKTPPISTPQDIGNYFDKLYRGQIVSSTYSVKMMDILKRQKINDRLPKYLPDDVIVAHKTGELDEYKNDGGIIFTNKGDYIIVVMSKTKDPYIAAEKIANYSKAIFDYFSSL